jgi:phenylpropionate dioxygenase-like ring-hydroxylating dioxygenase large terminal subunit
MHSNTNVQEKWFKVCKSKDLKDKPLSKKINGIPIVFFRGKEGKVGALLDRCPHRNIPMSKGWVENENLVCRHHGWHFNTEGVCTKVAQLKVLQEDKDRNAVPFTSVEQDGVIYVHCNVSPLQFPQIKAKPSEIKYVVPQFRDERFFRFFGLLILFVIIFAILIFVWFKLMPYYLFSDTHPF